MTQSWSPGHPSTPPLLSAMPAAPQSPGEPQTLPISSPDPGTQVMAWHFHIAAGAGDTAFTLASVLLSGERAQPRHDAVCPCIQQQAFMRHQLCDTFQKYQDE